MSTAPLVTAPDVTAPLVTAPAPTRRSLQRRLGRVGGLLLTLVMSLALMVFVAMTVLRFSGGELLAIRTGSMTPSMEPGDLLISRDVDPRTVRKGDVITFRVPSVDNTLVTHRVTKVSDNGNTFSTKGDANDTEDPFTTNADDVLGTRWFSIPKVGRTMVFLSTGLGTLLLILVPGAIYVGQTLVDRRAARVAAVTPVRAPSAVKPPPTSPPFPQMPPPFIPPASAAPPFRHAPPAATATTAAACAAPPPQVIVVQVPTATPCDRHGPSRPRTSAESVPGSFAVPVDQLPPALAGMVGSAWVLLSPVEAPVAGAASPNR